MPSKDSQSERRAARSRRRAERVAVEGLESRQLMTYSALGYSLPDLAVTGYAAPTAAWGGTLTVDVTVQNLGASSLVEPTNLAPGSASTADSPATTVQVYLSKSPTAKSGLLPVDTIAIPAVLQNSNYETISTITLPARPATFPASGGKVFVTLVVNNGQTFTESSFANNVFRVSNPVKISDPLPDLQVVGFDIQSPLHPGDVISPTIRIANFGSGNPAAQGPVTVDLVASTNTTFGPGDAVVASYTITSLPGISGIPTQGSLADDANVIPTANENTTTVTPFKLPSTPGTYYLGIVIDPYHTINQTYAPNAKLRDVVNVGPSDPLLPSGNLLFKTGGTVPTFPNAPSSVINPISTTTPVVVSPIFPNVNVPTLFGPGTGKVSSKATHAKTHKAKH